MFDGSFCFSLIVLGRMLAGWCLMICFVCVRVVFVGMLLTYCLICLVLFAGGVWIWFVFCLADAIFAGLFVKCLFTVFICVVC